MLTLPVCMFPKFKAKFEKVCRKAVKLGQKPPTFTCEAVLAKKMDYVTTFNPEGKYEAYNITFEGPGPKIEGHSLVASIDHTFYPNNIINFVPGLECDVSAFHHRQVCDHCHISRYRNSTLILREEATGNLIQIGRNCAKYFFQSSDMEAQICLWESTRDLENEDFDSGFVVRDAVCLDRFLSLLVWVCNTHGYMSKAKAQEIYETQDRNVYTTRDHLIGIVVGDPVYRKYHGCPTFNDLETKEIQEMVEELKALLNSLDDSTEYNRTLKTLSHAGVFGTKYFAVMASLWAVYKKKKESEAKPKLELKHFPKEPGFKFKGKAPCIIRNVTGFSTMYGYMTIVTMTTEEGYNLVWKTKSDVPNLKKEDKVVLEAFTVKEHTEYNGQPQTLILRVKGL